jgi:hypothetical protein
MLLSLLPVSFMMAATFDDPAGRGMPFKSEYRNIPEIYHGEWSDKRSHCGRQPAKGTTLVIERTRVNGALVNAVWAYSDYPAVILTLTDGSERGTQLHLDISHDEMTVKAQNDQTQKTDLLVRCPVSAASPDATASARTRMANACKRRDRDDFLDFFFAFPRALHPAFARKITIMRGDAPAKPWPRRFYQLPPIKFAPHAAYYEYGAEHLVPLTFETVSLANDDFRIDWEEERRDADGGTSLSEPAQEHPVGMRGRLTFKWVDGCWQLVSDEIRWSDWD